MEDITNELIECGNVLCPLFDVGLREEIQREWIQRCNFLLVRLNSDSPWQHIKEVRLDNCPIPLADMNNYLPIPENSRW